jgi:hypothetical protein
VTEAVRKRRERLGEPEKRLGGGTWMINVSRKSHVDPYEECVVDSEIRLEGSSDAIAYFGYHDDPI